MMDFNTSVALKKLNDERRQKLCAFVSQEKTDRAKIEKLCELLLKEYTFDYSVLDCKLEKTRPLNETKFEQNGRTYYGEWVGLADIDNSISVSPSIHALKSGTCVTYAAEMQWFAKALGIPCQKKGVSAFCYDNYKGIDDVRKMRHYYVILDIDGREQKVDVAGAIMAQDYLKKHKKASISAKQFLFVSPNSENPFNSFADNAEKGV